MSRHTLFLFIAVSLLSACAITPESSNAPQAVDAKGIRDLGDGAFLLDFLAIKAGAEDRTVLEFDAGERIAQVETPGNGAVRVEVAEAFLTAVDAGEKFIGLRLSTGTNDRYFLGEIADLPDPTISKNYGG